MKKLIACMLFGFSIQRPPISVEDLFNKIGKCQIELDTANKYIQQLEQENMQLKMELEGKKVPDSKGEK